MRRGTVPFPSGTAASPSGMEGSPSRVRGKIGGAPAYLQGMTRAPSTVLGAPSTVRRGRRPVVPGPETGDRVEAEEILAIRDRGGAPSGPGHPSARATGSSA